MFIASLSRLGNVSRACKAAKVDRHTAYAHRQSDEDFAAQWADALENSADWLEREAWRRAVKGTDKPVYQQGKRVGSVREFSDVLLIQLLRANRPEKFRENVKLEHTGAGGGPIQTAAVDLSRLSVADLRTLRELRAKATTASAEPSAN